ncbi:hypothetical protein R3P38DRAFT_3346068 [Favolaschia claudopus]|uniref:Uncharacterized protein n=1 Tax=Favolaschia claudopus TaxID=2862362 RepID=A0AAW0D639_9AGAR
MQSAFSSFDSLSPCLHPPPPQIQASYSKHDISNFGVRRASLQGAHQALSSPPTAPSHSGNWLRVPESEPSGCVMATCTSLFPLRCPQLQANKVKVHKSARSNKIFLAARLRRYRCQHLQLYSRPLLIFEYFNGSVAPNRRTLTDEDLNATQASIDPDPAYPSIHALRSFTVLSLQDTDSTNQYLNASVRFVSAAFIDLIVLNFFQTDSVRIQDGIGTDGFLWPSNDLGIGKARAV